MILSLVRLMSAFILANPVQLQVLPDAFENEHACVSGLGPCLSVVGVSPQRVNGLSLENQVLLLSSGVKFQSTYGSSSGV